MNKPVVAIGMDAAEPRLIEQWMSEGHLPNLSKIAQQGTYGRLDNTVNYRGIPTEYSTTEPLWVTFSTGCRADKTGYWDTYTYNPENYEVDCDIVKGGYDYQEYDPFYALGEEYKVAVFDLPVTTLSKQVNGLQVLGWGGHYPYTVSDSHPPEIFPSIMEKYGKNPVLHNDNGLWWQKKYVKWLQEALETSIKGHSQIARDLMKRDAWDLFLMVFGETHTVGHDLYNYSQPDHVLYNHLSQNGTKPDPMLAVYKNIDKAIGEVLTEVPEDSSVVCFAVHGMAANFSDLLSMAVLPELLYRFSFKGKVALTNNQVGTTPSKVVTNPIRNSWPGEIWSQMNEPNPLKKLFNTWTHKKFLRGKKHGVISPYSINDEPIERELAMGWMPVMWYWDLWPKMKAFALPGFTNGHIRINLKGREKEGIVDASEYDALSDEITEIMYGLRDGRTGKSVVKQVVKTRNSALDNNHKLPESDLVILWNEPMTDVVDSPDLGRIGPLTHCRAGGHKGQGFMMAKGAGIAPGSDLPTGEAVDLAPTILDLMGAPIPEYFDGKSLLKIPTLHS